jgi:hypothetical protein
MMSEPEIRTPLDLTIAHLEKLERQCRDMADHFREHAAKEDERAKLYATVIAHLKRTARIEEAP